MKVRITDQNGGLIQEIEDDDAETCEHYVAEAIGEELANGTFARMVVDVIER